MRQRSNSVSDYIKGESQFVLYTNESMKRFSGIHAEILAIDHEFSCGLESVAGERNMGGDPDRFGHAMEGQVTFDRYVKSPAAGLAGYLCASKHYLRILRRIEHYLIKLLLDNAFLLLGKC